MKLVNNHENQQILRIFGPDRAEVKLTSFITTDEAQLPDLDELLATSSPQRKKELFAAAVTHIVGSRVMTTIQNVRDNHEMTFGDTGYVLYQSDQIPNDFNWILLAVESDQDMREIGEDLESVIHHSIIDQVITRTLSQAIATANLSYSVAIAVGKFVTQMVFERKRTNKDDMIGILYTSLNRFEHYRHGERKKNHVPDLTNNMFVDYSIFGFDPQPQSGPIRLLPPVSGTIQPRRVA